MKMKGILLSLVALAVATTIAAAPAAAGKGKSDPLGMGCKSRVGLKLKGTLLAVDLEAKTLRMKVDKANRHGHRLAGTEVDVKVVDRTKIRRMGPAALEALVVGDLLKVKARVCKGAEAPELFAAVVLARAAQPAEEAEPAGEEESA